jgi:hypothetical protein
MLHRQGFPAVRRIEVDRSAAGSLRIAHAAPGIARIEALVEHQLGGEALVEALDAQGAVRSDPRARRFIWQTVSIVGALTILVIVALAYRDRNKGDPVVYGLVAVVAVIVTLGVCYKRFGNISDVEGDDGVTLTVHRRRQTMRVPFGSYPWGGGR